ncbi:unnamed protein product [Closterium sp. Yama58-4]|nr:unnamed protein product [Closterium sp. Yama58-4]
MTSITRFLLLALVSAAIVALSSETPLLRAAAASETDSGAKSEALTASRPFGATNGDRTDALGSDGRRELKSSSESHFSSSSSSHTSKTGEAKSSSSGGGNGGSGSGSYKTRKHGKRSAASNGEGGAGYCPYAGRPGNSPPSIFCGGACCIDSEYPCCGGQIAERVQRFAGGSTVTSEVTSGGESGGAMASGGRSEEAENVDGGEGGVGMEMRGVLFRWGEMGVKVAFRSSDFPRHVIILGGLTDGLLPTQYTARLASSLAAAHWSLLQTQLSSSYFGYGAASLEQDTTEIDELIAYIIKRYQASEVVLVGHSTGCQDIVAYLKSAKATHRSTVKAAILQAPTSDRECMEEQAREGGKEAEEAFEEMKRAAQAMVAGGRGAEMMPRSADPLAPITAYRFHSLACTGGADDMFSSDFSDEELKERLGHMAAWPSLVMLSGEDQYVPRTIDKEKLLRRLCAAMGGATPALIAGADHSLSNNVDEAVTVITDFIKKL